MGAAISLLVVLTVSVLLVRIAAVALRLTGMPSDVARFQARSAFSGSGFTTAESEAAVNHPVRRRIIGLLMLWGNVGFVTVIATFIVSFVSVENSMAGISRQLIWLFGAIALLWFIALNPFADRIMCKSIDWILQRTTSLAKGRPAPLLQLTGNFSVAEHIVRPGSSVDGGPISGLPRATGDRVVLGIEHANGAYSSVPGNDARLEPGDRLVLYASDHEHDAMHKLFAA